MSKVPHCTSRAALQVLLPRASVVVATVSLLPSFPSKVERACDLDGDILCVSILPQALTHLLPHQPGYEDVAVFAAGRLVMHVPRRPSGQSEALIKLFTTLFDPSAARRLEHKEAVAFENQLMIAVNVALAIAGADETMNADAETDEIVEVRDPYQILGVPRGATRREVKRARDRQLAIAHSDRVHGLHPEIQEMAGRLTRDIIWAHETITSELS